MAELLLESWTCQEKVQDHACHSKDWSCWSNWEIETTVAMTKMGSRMTEKFHVSFLFDKKRKKQSYKWLDCLRDRLLTISDGRDHEDQKYDNTRFHDTNKAVEEKLSCQTRLLEKFLKSNQSLSLLLQQRLQGVNMWLPLHLSITFECRSNTLECRSNTLSQQKSETDFFFNLSVRNKCSTALSTEHFRQHFLLQLNTRFPVFPLVSLLLQPPQIRSQYEKNRHRNRQWSQSSNQAEFLVSFHSASLSLITRLSSSQNTAPSVLVARKLAKKTSLRCSDFNAQTSMLRLQCSDFNDALNQLMFSSHSSALHVCSGKTTTSQEDLDLLN